MNAVGNERDRLRSDDGIVDTLRRADVGALTVPPRAPCVSFFLDRHGGPTGPEQDRIALKNLVETARRDLERAGVRAPVARRILRPALDLLGDPTSLGGSWRGLALYLWPDGWRGFRLPIEVGTGVEVGTRFRIRPLLPALSDDGRFYVLAVSERAVRLFVGTRDDVRQIRLRDAPHGLRDALRLDDPEKERPYHVSVRDGSLTAIAHGRGVGDEVDKERLTRYLRAVDDAIVRELRGERAPLVLAGSAPEPAIYRQITHYPTVLEDGIAGNPDRILPEDLHRRAWPLVAPVFRRTRAEAAERYRRLAGTGETTRDLAETVSAAEQGRVDVLFVSTDAQAWGTVEPTTGRVSVSRTRTADDVDLLEIAVVGTVRGDGTVYAVPTDDLPDGPTVAAILRY